MAAYQWSTLANNQSLSFSPTTDNLSFDDPAIDAAGVKLVWTDATKVQLSFGGKTISLLADVKSLTTTILTFRNGSLLLVGDNATSSVGDDGGNTLTGSAKADQILGLGGNDSINGGGGNDLLIGGDGNDRIFDQAGGDNTLLGGAGNDYLSSAKSTGDNLLDAGAGNDSLYGGNGADTLIGGEGEDYLSSTNSTGDNILDGGEGADTLYGGLGSDRLTGGEGNDKLYDTSAGDDTLLGGGGDDYLSTFTAIGKKLLDGGDGDDSLYGGNGEDTLIGGLGDDYLSSSASAGGKLLDGGDGADSLYGGFGDDHLDGGAGNDKIYDSSGGYNTLSGGAGDDLLSTTGNSGNNQLEGAEGKDTLYGGLGADNLTGGDGDDSLYGGDGNDTLAGGAGANMLNGGDGDDVYIISSRDFLISDSKGDDTAIVSVSFVKTPTTIEHVTYINGAQALPYWIDALIPDHASSFTWLLGAAKTFNYAYPTALPAYDATAVDWNGFQPFNAQQKAFSLLAMNYIAKVADLHFVETSTTDGRNTISFANNSQTSSSGYAYFPDINPIGSDIFLDDSTGNLAPADGQYAALTLIHELGHALGLKHPFSGEQAGGGGESGPYLPTAEDRTAWTVMSYTSNYLDYHLEYSDLDIAALQYLYGPSKTARTGDNIYTISDVTSNFIWDGGGKDTLSAQGLFSSATLYLEPGYWGYVSVKADLITSGGQVTVNFGTVIENLTGGYGDDRLYGNGVSNVITGGFGNDTIDGGAGDDTSAYQGLKSQYVITRLTDGSTTVRDTVSGRDGTDRVTNIEYLSFKDGVQALSSPIDVTRDFNADDHSDILLQNIKDGSCYVWAMNGLSLLDNKSFGYVGWTPGPAWQAKGTGDFNGDGKSDILLQNALDGACYVWQMNSLNLLSGGDGYVGWTPGRDWQVKATGDFNGDGKSDILLQNALDGACYVWQMNGLSLLDNKSFGYVGWTPGKDWQAKATGDFNGDGKSDVILQNALDGACYVWQMNGLSLLDNKSFGYVGWTPGKDWEVKSTGDFNGDGKSDILLQNALDGACYVWEMNGLSLLDNKSFGYVGWTPGKDWEVKSTGDFNGDGKSDILLQNANDGACYVWQMNGLSLLDNKSFGYVGWTPGADWHAVA